MYDRGKCSYLYYFQRLTSLPSCKRVRASLVGVCQEVYEHDEELRIQKCDNNLMDGKNIILPEPLVYH